MRVGDLLTELDGRFPFDGAGAWDPVGLQIGGVDRPASRVGVCHEITDEVIARALGAGITVLVTYHPLLFAPTTSLVEGPGSSGRALKLAEAGVSVIVVHTALDAAVPGTGDALADALGLPRAIRLPDSEDPEAAMIGRVSTLDEPMEPDALAHLVATRLGCTVRATAPTGPVRSVALIPGSGGGFIAAAAAAADAVITGDVSHHRAREGSELGLFVIDAGHASSERPGVLALYSAILDVEPDAAFIEGDPTPWKG
jgi:dinuclear metal center YbgI/SA1388 family protein